MVRCFSSCGFDCLCSGCGGEWIEVSFPHLCFFLVFYRGFCAFPLCVYPFHRVFLRRKININF